LRLDKRQKKDGKRRRWVGDLGAVQEPRRRRNNKEKTMAARRNHHQQTAVTTLLLPWPAIAK
jgi:hypothetical protein